MNQSRRTKSIIIGSVAVFVIVIVAAIITAVVSNTADRNRENSVYISNLESCSKNMQKGLQESMRTNMYTTIKSANEYNNKSSLPVYTATLREGSCEEEDIPALEGDGTIKESKAIIDIPEAQQSWAITYHWLPNGEEITSDLGTIVKPSCLEKSQLIYGDFNCEKIISLAEYGTDKPDPILPYMPYTGGGFTLDYNPENREVEAIILLRKSQKDNKELVDNLKAQVEYWFSKRDLNIADYKVLYSTQIESNTDANGNGYFGD